MTKGIYWVDGPWPGRLGIAARPRGGDWLTADLANWRHEGVDAVVSLLTRDEQDELSLSEEGAGARAEGMRFVWLPIRDRQVPDSESEVEALVRDLDGTLSARRNVLVHCRQGIGRSGLLAACVLIHRGSSPETALKAISEARGTAVPETQEQRRWIEQYAVAHAHR